MNSTGKGRVSLALVVALVASTLAPLAHAAPLPAALVSPTAISAAVATPSASLRSVSMLDASTAVAVATNGTIWRTTTGGNDWTQVRPADTYDLRAVDFWNQTKGVAVDLAGKVTQTTDGGVTWSNVDFWPHADMDGDTAPKNHHGLACIPGTTSWAVSVGGDPDITDDTWVGPVAMRNTRSQLDYWQNPLFQAVPHWYDVSGLGDYDWVGEGEFFAVDFVDGSNGWAAGRDTFLLGDHKPALYRTTDSGVNWSPQTLGFPATLNAVAFGTTTAGVVAGRLAADGTPRVYYTTNGGATWSQGTLPAGTGVPRALAMTSASAGWLVGDGGTLLRTTDGGATWTACTKPSGFSADLYDVKLIGTTGIAVGTGAVLRTTDGVTWTGGSTSVVEVTYKSVAGDDRIATAIEASKLAFPAAGSASTVVIATAWNWPDALGGAALAGAAGGPILLTNKDTLPDAVRAEIVRLGATKVYVLGGEAAVSPGVETALKAIPGVTTVTRLDGADRYATARRVASEVRVLRGAVGTAFVATGANFPDALGASPISANKRWPIYLVRPTGPDATLISDMKAAGVTSVVILGETGVIDTPAETTLKGQFASVTRIGGADRYDTARQVAAYGVGSGMSWNRVALATGANFPDALAGGVLQGRSNSVMLLTRPDVLYEGARTTLVANRGTITEVRFLGGTGAVGQAVRDAVAAALE